MHPDGGPELGLTLDPDRARAAAGFDYFSIGVPDRAGLDQLAPHLTALGEEHAGVHFATIGWILPLLHDPDGHEVRFYSVESHTTLDPDAPLTVDDAIGASARGRVARRAGVGLAPLDGSRAMNEWAQASALLGAIEYVEGGPLAVG